MEDRTVLVAPKFITPLAGTAPFAADARHSWALVNYVDLDPSTAAKDYRAGNYTYDGHNGLDMILPNFWAQDIGVPVYAGAGGTVTGIHDGEFDKNMNCTGRSNVVFIDHGDGYVSRYFHLRRNSVAVSVGEKVAAGQIIGLVGSSGCSVDPHLHFEIRRNGSVVETYQSPNTFWTNPLPYGGDTPGFLDFGVTDHKPSTTELRNRPAERNIFPKQAGSVWFWASVHGIRAGETFRFEWRGPDGVVAQTHTLNSAQIRYGWIMDGYASRQPLAGTWQVTVFRSGVRLLTKTYAVTASPAALAGQFNFNATNYYVTENSGAAAITVTRTGSQGAVSVQYSTSNSSALAGSDYAAVSGILSFGSGELRKAFTVPIVNDSRDEFFEALNLSLSGPTGGATLGGQRTAILRIIDNDQLPRITINDITITEGNSGTKSAVFTVTLSAISGKQVDVNFSTTDGSATAGNDYQSGMGRISILAGQIQKTMTIFIIGDALDEVDENFFVNLSNSVNASVSDSQGQGTILDDDPAS